MHQYMLSVFHEEGQELPSAEVMQQMYADVEAVNEQIRAAGSWVFGGGLLEPTTATVVRSQGSDIVTTDGPFPESKEQLGGFWIIKAEDLDAALGWAKKATVACRGPVEVRPFQDGPEA